LRPSGHDNNGYTGDWKSAYDFSGPTENLELITDNYFPEEVYCFP